MISQERVNEVVKELNSNPHPPIEYSEEIRNFLQLADEQIVKAEAGGFDYTIHVFKSRDAQPDAPLFINIHGGGWYLGHEDNDRYFSAYMADVIHGVVVDVDYTTSQYAPFDVMFAQCLDAVNYSEKNCEEWGCDKNQIFIGGYSAGGHLTAAVVNHLIKEGRHPFAGQILCYAPLDLRKKAPRSFQNEIEKIMAGRGDLFEELILRGEDHRRYETEISPALESDAVLCQCPKTLVITAGHCGFRFEDEAYAARLSVCGVVTTCVRFIDQRHGFIPHFMGAWAKAAEIMKEFIR